MATTQSLINYYANLLVLQYRQKPKAYATVQLLASLGIIDQLPIAIQAGFSLDAATGVQLDVLGKYAGVSRQGYDFTGPVTLNDSDFTILIKLAILQNNLGSSMSDIVGLIFMFFNGGIQAYDYQDMRMSYFFEAGIGSETLAEFFVRQHLLPKPMGVQLGALIYIANIDNLFGFRTYLLPPFTQKGFNSYTDYNTDWTWLSYKNAIAE